MKKYAIIAALVVLAALAFWFGTQRSTAKVARAAADTAAVSEPVQAAPAEVAAAATPTSAATAQESLPPPTEAENQVMSMYDAMVEAFATHRASCRDTAIAIENLIEAHRPALASLRDERKRLTPEEWSAAQQRLANTQGERLERARHAMEQTVKRCSTNERLRDAVRQLAAASN